MKLSCVSSIYIAPADISHVDADLKRRRNRRLSTTSDTFPNGPKYHAGETRRRRRFARRRVYRSATPPRGRDVLRRLWKPREEVAAIPPECRENVLIARHKIRQLLTPVCHKTESS